MCIPISVWGSLFWNGDILIPILIRVSLNRFRDSFDLHPHFALGIPVLVWGSPNRYGDPQTKMGCPRIDSKTMMAGYDDDEDGDWRR